MLFVCIKLCKAMYYADYNVQLYPIGRFDHDIAKVLQETILFTKNYRMQIKLCYSRHLYKKQEHSLFVPLYPSFEQY